MIDKGGGGYGKDIGSGGGCRVGAAELKY